MSRIEWPGSNAELVAQLAGQRSRYEQLVSNITDLLMLIDSDGTISFCNGRNRFCPGEAPCPKQGGKVTDCVAESDCRVVTDAVAEVLAGRSGQRDVVFRVDCASGRQRIIEGTFTPVIEEDRVVQVQFLGRDATDRRRDELALREAHAALKLRQKKLQLDLQVAGKIQSSFLPAPMATDEVLIDLTHVALMGVGGDYVHIHSPDPLRPTVIVFDVSGHGVASALVASRVHSAVHAALDEGAAPQDMIGRLNRFIYDSFADMGIFVTLFALQLDLHAGRACYCGAGHPPGLLRPAGTDRIQRLESTSLPIGVAPDAPADHLTEHVDIHPGDTIWLYTDGLYELWTGGETMLGIDGLERYAATVDASDPQPGFAERCMQAILAERDRPEDDITLVTVAVRKTGDSIADCGLRIAD